MDTRRMIKYFLVIGAICVAGYLTFDLISGDIARKQDEQVYCTANCRLNPYSFFWEFIGGSTSTGFTTKEECLRYCVKSREGFVYRFVSESYASFISSPWVSNFLKFINLGK